MECKDTSFSRYDKVKNELYRVFEANVSFETIGFSTI